MANAALNWAREQRTGTAGRKLVLLVLADRASDDDWTTWAGQDRLAAECELTGRSVRRILADLERQGLIEREQRRRPDGYRTSDLIRLAPTSDPPPGDGPGPVDNISPDIMSGETMSPDMVSASADQDTQPRPHRTQPPRTQFPGKSVQTSPETVSDLTGHSFRAKGTLSRTPSRTPAATHVPRAERHPPADEHRQQLITQAAHMLALRRAAQRPDVGPGWIINATRGITTDHHHTAHQLLNHHTGPPPTPEQLANWLEPPPTPDPPSTPDPPPSPWLDEDQTRARLDEQRSWQPAPAAVVRTHLDQARQQLHHPEAS